MYDISTRSIVWGTEKAATLRDDIDKDFSIGKSSPKDSSSNDGLDGCRSTPDIVVTKGNNVERIFNNRNGTPRKCDPPQIKPVIDERGIDLKKQTIIQKGCQEECK